LETFLEFWNIRSASALQESNSDPMADKPVELAAEM
jgi:hypothetical protein